ncbi:MAG: cytochrome c [Gammaproteobacteria bacterium]|nr:cytochrome c [Gammaproteobacteria bacterium]
MLSKKTRFLAAAALGLCMTSVVAEGTKPEDVVEYRKSVFRVIAWNFGPLVAMVKGEMDYDPAEFTLRAERMAALSSQPLEGFLPDTLVGDSEAKPEIWENWADFKAKMADLEEATSALAEASLSGDMKTIVPAFKATGGACKACHDDYKEE